MFLELLEATMKMSCLGFALGCLYHTLFSPKLPPQGRFEKVMSTNLARTLAFPGFVFVLVAAGYIALDGLDLAKSLTQNLRLSAHYLQYAVGAWLEAAIVLGWAVEYETQRRYRIVPKFGFNF